MNIEMRSYDEKLSCNIVAEIDSSIGVFLSLAPRWRRQNRKYIGALFQIFTRENLGGLPLESQAFSLRMGYCQAQKYLVIHDIVARRSTEGKKGQGRPGKLT